MANRTLRGSITAVVILVIAHFAPANSEEVPELTADDIKGALDSNSELMAKKFGRVDFHVIDEATGEIVHVESLLPAEPQSAGFVILSYSINLPAAQRCGAPKLTRAGAGVVVVWCDPGNLNRLQSDIYQMKLNGSKGAYLISFKAIHCVNESADIPEDISDYFC